jgi:uncharacterized protein YcbK (DUF882 family)
MRTTGVLAAGILVAVVTVRPTQDVVAQGATRTLTIYHAHTKEQETVTYKQFGSYSSAGLEKLNWLLRDWRIDEPTRMDPSLFDILWEVQRATGSSDRPIHVVSAYRSPGTNAMLARRSRGVAKHSQHMNGRAMDFAIPGVPISQIRDIGLRLQAGGVGYYPNANNPWVHLDTGGVRHWPKVSRDYLVRLFPDEKTVHIPADGRPLAGFEAARAIIEARGGSVSSGYIDIAEGRATGKTLFQILFGGGEDDEETTVASRGKRGRTAVASRQPRQQVAAVSQEAINEGSAMAFFASNNTATSAAPQPQTPAAQASIRSRAQRPTPLPEPQDEAPAAQAKQAAPKPAEPTPAVEPKREEPPKAIAVAALQPKTELPLSTKSDAEELRRVSVPLPQRRPSDLQTGPTLVAIPLPQSRPTTLLAFAPTQQTDPIRAILDADPAGAKPIQAAVPLPPSRPADLPSAITAGLRTTPAEATTGALAYGPASAAPRPAAPQPLPPPAIDRKGMNSLMAQIAATANPERGGRVQPPSVAAVAELKTVTGRFEPAQPRVEPAGFTGSAIRPLAPQGFRRVE